MKELNILYVTDEKFAPIVGVSVTSMFENNPSEQIALTVYILTTDMGEENRALFSKLADRYHQNIQIIDVGQQLQKIEQLNLAQYRGSAMTNLRLFFDKFIPQEVQRILYVDADTIICGSLEYLAELDMNEKMLAMVYDAYGDIIATENQQDTTYYNAGVILVDCEKWREDMWRRRIVEFINCNGAQFAHPDQDIYNILCNDEIMRLPINYNFQPVHQLYQDEIFFNHLGKNKYYSKEEVANGRQQPIILHMIRMFGKNPWHENNKHPFYEQYKKYKEISYWNECPQDKNRLGILIYIEIILDKILPQKVFFPISLVAIKACVVK